MIRVFVSYSISSCGGYHESRGFGNCELMLDEQPRGYDDIVTIQKRLEQEAVKEGVRNPVVRILYWKAF